MHPRDFEVFCGVCGQKTEVEFDVSEHRTFVESMAGHTSRCDRYTCPDKDEKWHEQVVALRHAASKTPSGKLAAMFHEEAAEVLSARKPTKEKWNWM
jgi:hypothetical protein